jgi:hypothetical protein
MEPSLPAYQTDTPPGSAGLGWRSGWRIEDDTIGARSSNDVAVATSMGSSSRREALQSARPG